MVLEDKAAGGGSTAESERPPDRVLRDVLDAPRRRLLLSVVAAAGEVPISTAARRVAAAERDDPPERVPEEAVDAVERDVYQTHLPKLTALRIVAYDSLVASLALGPNADALFEFWRERADEDEFPSPDATAPSED